MSIVIFTFFLPSARWLKYRKVLIFLKVQLFQFSSQPLCLFLHIPPQRCLFLPTARRRRYWKLLILFVKLNFYSIQQPTTLPVSSKPTSSSPQVLKRWKHSSFSRTFTFLPIYLSIGDLIPDDTSSSACDCYCYQDWNRAGTCKYLISLLYYFLFAAFLKLALVGYILIYL